MKDKKIIKKRRFQGKVVATKMQKTITVLVESIKVHPKYHKQYKWSTKYKVHDELGKAKINDLVIFEECRPISKDKRWNLVEIKK